MASKSVLSASDAELRAGYCKSKKNWTVFRFHRIDRKGLFRLSTVPTSMDALFSERLQEDVGEVVRLSCHLEYDQVQQPIVNSSTSFAPERVPPV